MAESYPNTLKWKNWKVIPEDAILPLESYWTLAFYDTPRKQVHVFNVWNGRKLWSQNYGCFASRNAYLLISEPSGVPERYAKRYVGAKYVLIKNDGTVPKNGYPR